MTTAYGMCFLCYYSYNQPIKMETESKKISIPPSLAILIAGVLIAGAVIYSSKDNTRVVALQGAQQQAAAQGAPQIAVDIRKVKTAGAPFIGNPNAPVTVAYWYDYQCPFCKRNEEATMPQLVTDYVDTGKVKIVFKDYEFLGPDSQTLGQYSRAVWNVAPDQFYKWHKAVFDNQGTENTGWATKEKIQSITSGVLGAAVTSKVTQDVTANGASYQKIIDSDKSEGAQMGITGTPGAIIGTQFISGAQPYASFKKAIDVALQAK